MTDMLPRTSQEILAAVREVEDEAPGGVEALFMAAMLADAPLPYDFALAVAGTQHNPSLAHPAAAFFAATATIEPLVERELVDADFDAQVYSLPTPVREAVLNSLSVEERKDWAGRAIYALNLVLPDAEPQNWPTVQWLLPHIRACCDLVDETGVASVAVNRVLHQAGFSLYHQQRHHEAADLLDRALAVDVAVKGQHHPDICADLEGLGNVLWAAGELERAEAAFAGCLELQQAVFTDDNLVTAPILNSLGVVRHALANHAGAEEAFKTCLRVLTKYHGEGDPAVASCLSNLALLYEAMGRLDEALRLGQRSLEINRAEFGDENPEVASDLNTVALLYDAAGRPAEAEAHFRESLDIRLKIHGQDHLETAQSFCNLALWLDKAGKTTEAVDFYEQGLAAYDAVLGAGHPFMEPALDNYILLLEKTGTRPASDQLRTLTEQRLRSIVQRAR